MTGDRLSAGRSLAELARDVAALANELVAEARSAGRDDVVDLLTEAADRWSAQEVTVVLAGETGVGKSSLLGALLGRHDLLPSGFGVSTRAVTIVRGATLPVDDQPSPPDPLDRAGVSVLLDGTDDPVPVTTDELASWTTTEGETANGVREVRIDLSADPGGLPVLVDTPPVAGADSLADRLVVSLLRRSDLLVFVTDPDAPLSAAELDFLREARDVTGTAVVAVSRIDRYRGWTTILDDSAALLDRELGGWVHSVHGVSSTLHRAAVDISAEDPATARELGEESGIRALRATLGALTARVKHLRLLALTTTVARAAEGMAEPARMLAQATAVDSEQRHVARQALDERRGALTERGSAVLRDLPDLLAGVREQIGVELRRIVADLNVDHEERMVDPRADADAVLDALEHDLRGAQSRFEDSVTAQLAEVAKEIDARLTGGPAPEPTPTGDEATATRRAFAAVADQGLRLRFAAALATAGSGTVLIGMTYMDGSVAAALRGTLMGASMLLGGVVANLGIRQTRQQKVLQTVRARSRGMIDEWQATVLAEARRNILGEQRRLESAVRSTVRGALAEVDAQLEAVELAPEDSPGEAESTVARLDAWSERAAALDLEVRTALGA